MATGDRLARKQTQSGAAAAVSGRGGQLSLRMGVPALADVNTAQVSTRNNRLDYVPGK